MGRTAKYITLRAYQPYIDIVMDDLGLTGKVNLTWKIHPLFTSGGSAQLFNTYTNGLRNGEVILDNRASHEYALITILHELKHIQQYYTRRLAHKLITYRKRNGNLDYKWVKTWEGIDYESYSQYANKPTHTKEFKLYRNQPWEIEATKYEKGKSRLFPKNALSAKREYIGKVQGVTFYKVKG